MGHGTLTKEAILKKRIGAEFQHVWWYKYRYGKDIKPDMRSILRGVRRIRKKIGFSKYIYRL